MQSDLNLIVPRVRCDPLPVSAFYRARERETGSRGETKSERDRERETVRPQDAVGRKRCENPAGF